MSLKTAFTENIGIKIIAVLVALILWFNVSSQEEITRLLDFPIQLINIPDSLTVTGQVPQQAEVNVTATKRQLIYMGFKKAVVVLNLADATQGRYRQMLSASNVLLPPGITPTSMRIIQPTSVDLFFERKVSKRIPVGLSLSGSVTEGYLLNDVPSVRPEMVEIIGAESFVTHLKSIPTKPVDLSKIKDSFNKEIEIDYDRKVFQCVPDQVTVMISVSPRGKRILANIPPTIFIDKMNLIAEVSPKTISLTLEGPKAMLDTLSSGDVSVLLDLAGKPLGVYTLAPEIIVPSGVEKFSLDAESLRVEIKEKGSE